jgi:translation initiation factor IF-3
VTIFFRYRQLRRPELGAQILDKVTKALADVGTVESRSRLDGRRMVMVLAPLPADTHKKQQDAATKKNQKPSPAPTT